MTRYLLDNGVLIAYLKGRPGALRLVRPWIMAREAATSHLIYGEAIEYLKSASDYRQRRTELRILLREVTPYQLTYPNPGTIRRPASGDAAQCWLDR